MEKRTVVYALCGLALLPLCAAGAVLPFGDTSPSWGTDFNGNDFNGTPYQPNQQNGFVAWAPPPTTPNAALPTVDENGGPILKSNNSQTGEHQAVVTNGKLAAITITYHHHDHGNYWGTLKPGDLFLDVDGQYGFDYVARTPYFADGQYFDTHGTPNSSDGFNDSSWELYALDNLAYREDQGQDGGPYQLANDSSPANGESNWSRYWVRDYHPWALKSEYVTGNVSNDGWGPLPRAGTVQFSGWANLGNNTANTTNQSEGQSTWIFDDYDIDLKSTDLTIGWTVNCANDVLLTDVPGVHLPEPGSLAVWGLLGLGVVGLGAARRRRGNQPE